MAQIVEVVGVGNVEFPDGMSKEAMAQALSKLPKPKQTIHTEETIYDPLSGLPLSSPSYGPEATGATKTAQNVLTGAAALPVSVATGVARGSGAARIPQLVGKILGAGDQGTQALGQIEKGMEQQGGEYLQKGANIVGQAAPFVMGGMGGSPLGTTSISDKVMNVANKIPALPSYAKNILGNTALGGVAAAANPESNLSDIGTTAAISGAIPAVAQPLGWLAKKGYDIGKAVVEPLYKGGREEILGKALRAYAGSDAEKAINNLLNAEPKVAGSMPTVGQAAGVPSMAAAERSVMATSPEATNLLAARQAEQNAARTEALNKIVSPTRVNKYSSLRNELGDELYTPALNTAMDFRALSKPMQKEVESLANTPAIKRAMSQARENALNKGYDIGSPNGSLQGLHETKMALDQEINAVKAKLQRDQAGATSAELDGLKAAKDRLLGFIETVSPEYKTARETYARLSKPVEQLELIQNVAKRSINPATDAIYPQQFARNLQALKNEGKLTPQQLNRLEAINQDLQSSVFANTAGKGVGSDTAQKLAYTNMLNTINLPSLLRRHGLSETVGNLAARASDVVYGNANKQLASELAQAFANPQEAARLMQNAVKPLAGGFSPTVLGKKITPTEQAQLAKMLMMQEANRLTQGEK